MFASACLRQPELPGTPADEPALPAKIGGTCDLLTRGELELALNVTLPQTFSSTGVRPVLPGMDMCRTATPSAAASWGVLSGNARSKFLGYKRWHDRYVKTLRHPGEHAIWDSGLRTLLVLDGSRAFGLRVHIEDPPVKGKDSKDYVEQTSQALAERALSRLSDYSPHD